MTDKERYATIGTWVELFQREGFNISDTTVRVRIREAGLIGEMARNKIGRLVKHGFYAESTVRKLCADLLQESNARTASSDRLSSYPALDFADSSKVLADLNAFAAQLPQTSDNPKTPVYLSTTNLPSLSAICHNGEAVKGATYLNRAAIALGLAENSREAQGEAAKIINVLLKIAGVETRDTSYYQTKEIVLADLNAFVAQLSQEPECPKTPFDLGGYKILSLAIVCHNGEIVTGNTYLRNGAIALGLAKDSRESDYKKAETLNLLLRNAGLEVRDSSYYQTPEFVLADLNAIAAQLPLTPDGPKTPNHLSTHNMQSLSFTCNNGETVKAATYLYNAAIALGLAKNARDATSKRAEALKRLKEIAGLLSSSTKSDD